MYRFALLGSWIGLENLPFFFFPTNQLGATHKRMAAWSPAFSHASGNLLVFTLSLLAFVVFIFVVSGRCDNFGSGFMTYS